MSNQTNQNQVQPGPCPVIDGIPVCPPPTEIDIIKVKKVFQECQHTQVEEVQIEFEVDTITNNLVAECVSVEILEQECRVLNGGLIKVTATLAVTSSLNGQQETVEFSIDKNFRLSRAGENGLTPQCHIFPTCLFCFVSDEAIEEEETIVTVTCCVGLLILIKLEAEVQLLIPTYGYPPLPPECDRVIGECPDDFEPVWPPYPPQNRGGNNTTGGCKSCG